MSTRRRTAFSRLDVRQACVRHDQLVSGKLYPPAIQRSASLHSNLFSHNAWFKKPGQVTALAKHQRDSSATTGAILTFHMDRPLRADQEVTQCRVL
jgi:hypothetical protein